jgi:hypothetical protein
MSNLVWRPAVELAQMIRDRRIPTAGMIPEVPGMPYCLRQMMTVGCFARSLEDLRLCFSLLAVADPRRPDVPPVPLDSPSGKSLSDCHFQRSCQIRLPKIGFFSVLYESALPNIQITVVRCGGK